MPPRDFDYAILDERGHRPWPMPTAPWLMTQTWRDLLFAHWRVPAAQLLPKIPSGLTLDLFEGEAWVAVVPFWMSNVAPRGMPPLPWLSAFPELNVRTYVRVGDKPGVFFFSLDASNPVIVATARLLFSLPYFTATMNVDVGGIGVTYESRRKRSGGRVQLSGSYRPIGPVFAPQPETLEYFLTERYCLYTIRRRSVVIVDIHHPPWPLQLAEASFAVNTMAEASGIPLHGPPMALHFARRQDVVSWAPTRVRQQLGSATPAGAIQRDQR
jgi:uncharacterized protein YqjF (DUF2071 family)